VSAPPYSIAILGNDAFLAAAPAHPVQLMHGALAAGFDAVVPVSLGDELVAGETLRIAQLRGRRPLVQCSCVFALQQLCKREANLNDVTVAVAPSAVALARALRSQRTEPTHITVIGACPGAHDPAVDLVVKPEAFLRGLVQRRIILATQPEVFSDRLPPDRRRYLSTPGGAPRPDLVAAVLRRTSVTLVEGQHPMLAIADALFDGGATLIDPAAVYRCHCAGAGEGRTTAEGRAAMEALEPLRSTTPIFEAPPWLDLRPSAIPGDDTNDAADPGLEPPSSFSDAVRLDPQAPPPPHLAEYTPYHPASHAADARRLYALGVRSTRRRATLPPGDPGSADHAEPHAGDDLLPPTTPALRAPHIERAVPITQPQGRLADYTESLPEPPVRPRQQPLDDAYRRD